MDDLTQIFVPLRSNAAWFGDADCRMRLERQFKTYLILYDRILFEKGRFHITAGVDGQGMQMDWPGDTFPGDRSKISFFTTGGPFGVEVGGKRVLASTSEFAFDVDYLPIVRDAGLEYATFIRWSDDEIPEDLKSAVGQRVRDELREKSYDDVLPKNSYLRQHVLEGLYRDSLLAHLLKAPFCVDFHASNVIAAQQKAFQNRWSAELPVAFFNYWVNLQLPNFAELPWDVLCEFRETDAGVSFRRMVHRLSKRVRAIAAEAADQRDVDHWLAQEFNRELLVELSQRIHTPGSTITSMCLNVIPFGFIPSLIKDAKALNDDQASWVSTVRGFKANE